MGLKCPECPSEFLERRSLEQHMQARHSGSPQLSQKSIENREQKERKRLEKKPLDKAEKKKRTLNYIIGILIIAALGYGVYSLSTAPPPQSNSLIPIGPIHWHPTLEIFINGEKQVIPANVGITPTFESPIHTHAEDNLQGVIHVENKRPTEDNMKLGYFFSVWGKRFDSECIFDYCNNENSTVKFFVNGQANFEFGKHIMGQYDQMRIEYSPV